MPQFADGRWWEWGRRCSFGSPQTAMPGSPTTALATAPMGNQGIGPPQAAMPINRFNPPPQVR